MTADTLSLLLLAGYVLLQGIRLAYSLEAHHDD